MEHCRIAEQIIKNHLKAPSTADWTGNCWRADGRGGAGYDLTTVSANAKETMWTIGVDSQNSFGAMIRTTCVVIVSEVANNVQLVGCE